MFGIHKFFLSVDFGESVWLLGEILTQLKSVTLFDKPT
jgi:hypothetical protein